ncbi:MAG: glycoside hydrolase family 3 N-terminal domain-containing protein [Candidatus Nanohalobium sp.]
MQTSEEVFKLGKKQGKFLEDIGADIDFSPVLDRNDTIWKCRSLPGNYRKIAEKGCAYIEGLQSQGIMTTAKHYPGNTLTGKDPHSEIKKVTINGRDLFPFRSAIRCGTDAIMASHQITNGTLDTDKPADVSRKVSRKIRSTGNFSGLVISDAISMEGLTKFYDSRRQRNIDLFRNNDLVLNLIGGRNDTIKMVNIVENAVKNGELEQKYIDRSARRLLQARGLNVRRSAEEGSKRWEAWSVTR